MSSSGPRRGGRASRSEAPQRRSRPQQDPDLDSLGQLTQQIAQSRRLIVPRQPEIRREVPARDMHVRASGGERFGDMWQRPPTIHAASGGAVVLVIVGTIPLRGRRCASGQFVPAAARRAMPSPSVVVGRADQLSRDRVPRLACWRAGLIRITSRARFERSSAAMSHAPGSICHRPSPCRAEVGNA